MKNLIEEYGIAIALVVVATPMIAILRSLLDAITGQGA